MSSIFQDIRTALEVQLSNIPSVPQIAYENVSFEPTTGTPWVAVQLVPTNRRPAVRGLNPQQRYGGLWRIDVMYPEGNGPNDAEVMADAILETFEATTDLTTSGGRKLSIETAERTQGTTDSPWFVLPLTISWYIYS